MSRSHILVNSPYAVSSFGAEIDYAELAPAVQADLDNVDQDVTSGSSPAADYSSSRRAFTAL